MYAVAIPVMALVAPGPEVTRTTAGFTGGTGVAVSHMGRGLLVTNQDVSYIRFLEQGIVDMKESTTRVPVDVLDAFVTQKADEHLTPPDKSSNVVHL